MKLSSEQINRKEWHAAEVKEIAIGIMSRYNAWFLYHLI